MQLAGLPQFAADGIVSQWGTILFSNPDTVPLFGSLIAAALSPKNVKGLLVFHVIGKRLYTNNIPTSPSNFQTLLNTNKDWKNHPGLKLNAAFSPPFPSFANSVTVKDTTSAPPAHVIINYSPMLPHPIGTSDQTYWNGVLHKIDAVLSPM